MRELVDRLRSWVSGVDEMRQGEVTFTISTADVRRLVRALDGIRGTCVEIGEGSDGQPRLMVHTTREEIKGQAGSYVYADVVVRLADRMEG